MKQIITIFALLIFALSYNQVDYDTQIQPIFDSRCVDCHGNMGGLDLSSYENLMSGGISGQSVIPFDHFYNLIHPQITPYNFINVQDISFWFIINNND